MRYTTAAAIVTLEFTLEDAPVTSVDYSAAQDKFLPDFCKVFLEIGPEGPVLDRLYLYGHRIKKNGTPGRARSWNTYTLDGKNKLWPTPPEHVRELLGAAMDISGGARLRPAPSDTDTECFCDAEQCVTPCERCKTRCAVGTLGVCDTCMAADDDADGGR